LDITPLPLEGKTEITYTGTGDIFDAEFISNVASMEFVLFEGHLNPATFAPTNTVNGNYTPSTITSRYSFVTDIINGKKIKVGFVYNGGNSTTPQSQISKSGYFFINNRLAFRAAFNNNNTRDTKIVLKSGKTYVTKGGWNSTVTKDLLLTKDNTSSAKPAIKISMEDAFSVPATDNSFNATFGSDYFFLLTSASNNGMNITIENIDILPSHMTQPSAQYSNDYINTPFFSHLYNSVEFERWGTSKVVNSNGLKEKEYLDLNPATFITPPAFVLPQFAFSNNGGKLNPGQTDIEEYQYFILERSKWQCVGFHNLKFQKVNGNYLKLLGTSTDRNFINISLLNDNLGSPTYDIKIEDDGTGKFRKLKTTSNKSFYILANQYWYGNAIVTSGSYTGGRLQWFTVVNGGETFYFYPPNQHAVQQGYGGTYGSILTIASGDEIRMYEEVPIAGVTTIAINNTSGTNRKVDNTTFDIYGYGLQAVTSYPDYLLNSPVQTLTSGDVLTLSSINYNILTRKRIINPNARFTIRSANGGTTPSLVTYTTPDGVPTSLTFTGDTTIDTNGSYSGTVTLLSESAVPGYPIKGTPGWRITIDNPITASSPFTFTVTTSRTEFITSGSSRASTWKIYNTGGYFCYGSFNMNFEFEYTDFNGFGRYTDNPLNLNGTPHTYSVSSPLYLLTLNQSFKNSNHTGVQMLWEISLASGLQYRNLKLSPAIPYAVEIDNSRVWWTRTPGSVKNPVRLKNRPTLMHGGSYGEPRIENLITDGTGFISELGATLYFTDSSQTYDLSNVYLKTPTITFGSTWSITLHGTGNIIMNNFDSDLVPGSTVDYGQILLASGCFLNITANSGRGPITVDGTFNNSLIYPSTNRLILANWTLRRGQFGNTTGYRRLNASWPATATPPVLPNFSITNP
jgi:hypothetical protein